MRWNKWSLWFLLFACFTTIGRAQVAVKTNLVSDAVLIPNLGLEVGLAKKWTFDLPVYYNPRKYNDTHMLKLLVTQPELRYWFCDKFNGHFLGLHGLAGVYQTQGYDWVLNPFDQIETTRNKGRLYGGGLTYGYQWILGKHWNVEASVGAGYLYLRNRQCKECEQEQKKKEHYIGPTKAALNLIYLF